MNGKEINMQYSAWEGFMPGEWTREVNVSDFIDKNYTPYEGDETFLCPSTERTVKLWEKVKTLMLQELQQNGVLDIDTHTISSINSHAPGYVDRDLEIIVGLQTDAPLKRAVMPAGGIRMVNTALESYGYETDPDMERTFTLYRKTHNQGVFDAYTPEIRLARKAGIITGLPDAYGRGRIIGDYRRVALYGVNFLIEDRINLLKNLDRPVFNEAVIQIREELSEGIRALKELKEMTAAYGSDISARPQCPRSRSVYLLCLSGHCQRTKRRCHESGTYLHLPGHLF